VNRLGSRGVAILLVVAGVACGQRTIGPEDGRRPDILLITVDDMGLELGAYGDPHATTPNVDRLAAQGLRFDRAFVVASTCSPSRSTILTGIFPHANGHWGFVAETRLHDGIRTLPTLLGEAGYRTGLIGKLHVAGADDQLRFDRAQPLEHGERSPAAFGTAVADFLAAGDGRPFFLMVNSYDPHTPYPGQEGVAPWPVPHDPRHVRVPAAALDTPELRQFLARMYDGYSKADEFVGATLDALERAGKADSTLVLFLSDHGPPLPAAKATLFEAGIHVPLVARWPGRIEPGRTTDALISGADVVPTLLEVAGRTPDPALHGRSFLGLLTGVEPDANPAIYAEGTLDQRQRYFPQRAVRTGQFKYIRNLRPEIEFASNSMNWWVDEMLRRWDTDPRARFLLERLVRHPREELYDLERDPEELRNLAGDPSQAATLERLRGRLEQWMRATGDPWVALWDHDPARPDPLEPSESAAQPLHGAWLDMALEQVRRRSR